MDNNLKNELATLLQRYPELKGSQINFHEEDFSLLKDEDLKGDQGNDEHSEDIEEKKLNPFSIEVITGSSPKVEVRLSKIHGYGVIAKQTINEGEVVEQCRLLKLAYRSNYNIDPVLKDYSWGKIEDTEENRQHGNIMYLALGIGSLFNHSDNPNTTNKIDYDAEIMTMTSCRTIHEGEEVFISYGNKYFLIRDFWKNIKESGALERKLLKTKMEKEIDI